MNIAEAKYVADLEASVAMLEHTLRRVREESREWKYEARIAVAKEDLLAALSKVIKLLEDEDE
jgi:hypothetical protein